MTQQLDLCGAGRGSVLILLIPTGLTTAQVFPAQNRDARPGPSPLSQVHELQKCATAHLKIYYLVLFVTRRGKNKRAFQANGKSLAIEHCADSYDCT